MGLITFLFGASNKSNVKALEKIAKKVEDLDEVYSKKTDMELIKTTKWLKDRLAKGETLDDILPDAFACVREASWRVLHMKHFHVQILGGIALHQGRIAEMRTGEGKTLVATLPTYLNALSGKGVHVVTVNEYLAKRDAEWMGKVHKFLGLTVGVSARDMSDEEKRKAYACDITYSTNSELGFDYLRDNRVQDMSHKVQRGHNFAIVDEVDSILIDEARTPLILSGRGTKSNDMYYVAQRFVKTLNSDDYEIDEKLRTVILTESGISKAERFFRVETLSDISNLELNHHINNALQANLLMKRDDKYIVKEGEVIIVDEFTGRLMPGRRFSEGLHQAIEAKEGLKIKDENKTFATITFQNYFRMYSKLSGMTGTAKTEEREFNGIYKLDVVTIPTNAPILRFDRNDIIYTTQKGKFEAVVERIKKETETGRPILVGTVSVEKSEMLSEMLKKAKVRHVVLNAKNPENESEIVAQAGRIGAVTISTNMAGRGTDILLGGNPEFMAKKALKEKGYTDAEISIITGYSTALSEEMKALKEEYYNLYNEFKKTTDAEKEKVKSLGGLLIIGTERHESRRIDNQLRGRAGRQGDPGESVFYVSMEDDLVRIFGGDRMKSIANFFKIGEDVPFQFRSLSKSIENAQKRLEERNYNIRSAVLEYDDVMNQQRETIYAERNKVLAGENIHEEIVGMFPDVLQKIVFNTLDEDKPYFEWDLKDINTALEDRLFEKGSNIVDEKFVEDCEVQDVYNKLLKIVVDKYENLAKTAKGYGYNFDDFERYFLLRVVDVLWTEHIDTMDMLRKEIRTMAFGNKNPVIEYKREGFDLFDAMTAKIREDVCTFLINVKVEAPPEMKPQEKEVTTTNESTSQAKSNKVVGRNDPCPCGSGKKYKNCCGKNKD